MEGSHINYGRIMERAMRSVMADVLGQVAENGLLGGHHFYITFDTTHVGVDMPAYLKERYPREMMIVMQEWFDDLAVMGDRFRVTLNFSDQPQTLVIPFDAVKTFIDPSVKFGLKFDDQEGDDDESAAETFPGERVTPVPEIATAEEAEAPAPKPEGGSAEIVSIDKFRKS
ncbi:MAG: ClpXP protease specificity-enhancing factor SspB [Pseudomonadota bacterium]